MKTDQCNSDPFRGDGGRDLTNEFGGLGAGRGERRKYQTIGNVVDGVGDPRERYAIVRISVYSTDLGQDCKEIEDFVMINFPSDLPEPTRGRTLKAKRNSIAPRVAEGEETRAAVALQVLHLNNPGYMRMTYGSEKSPVNQAQRFRICMTIRIYVVITRNVHSGARPEVDGVYGKKSDVHACS